jgi:endonuclease/exonuclease/phosphatase (EEP) superfamily protein YafD
MTVGHAVLLVLTAGWLVFVLARRFLSGRHWMWLLPDLLPPATYLAVPLVLVTVAIGTQAQPWCAVGAVAALVIGIGHSGLNPGALRRPAPPPAKAIRVVSWNTEYWDQAETAKHLHEFLAARRADIYVLQERIHGRHTEPRQVRDLPRLRAEFPGYHVAEAGELITLSRFPITAPASARGADWRGEFDATKFLRTDVRVGSAVLSLYNVHIPTQYVVGDNPFRRSFYAALRDRYANRTTHLRKLCADLAANRHATLVSGDFNSTAAMGEMRWLLRHLRAANQATRQLWPATWPAGGLALWQLDWTFTSGVLVHRYRLLDPRGISDHRVQELLISVPQKGDTP